MTGSFYRCVERMHWRGFGDDWVVLLVVAGVVCQLDAFNATVLTLIESGVGLPDQIAQQISSSLGQECNDVLVAKVSGVCDELVTSGVVEVGSS